MPLRPPSRSSAASVSGIAFDALGHEILAEKAAALGRAGERAELCVGRLNRHLAGETEQGATQEEREAVRKKLLREAADAVYAWFIQRELCGFRRHDAVIRDLKIPREVLVRLGAK
jgi:hypothetical protein